MLPLDPVLTGTKSQVEKMKAAVALANKILVSEEFKKAVIEQTYEYYKCTGMLWWKKCNTVLEEGFTSTKLTTQQVYSKIVNSFGISFSWNCVDARNRNVIGYTYADVEQINTYKWVVDSYEVYELAGHLIHEWLHVLGFSHSSAKDHNSVPYALGYDAESIGKLLVSK